LDFVEVHVLENPLASLCTGMVSYYNHFHWLCSHLTCQYLLAGRLSFVCCIELVWPESFNWNYYLSAGKCEYGVGWRVTYIYQRQLQRNWWQQSTKIAGERVWC